MRVEVGAITIVVEKGDDSREIIRDLFKCMNNKEASEWLGVTPRTIAHWKREGWLPQRGMGQIMLVDLLTLNIPEPRALTKHPGNGATEGKRNPENRQGKKTGKSERGLPPSVEGGKKRK